MDLQFNHVVSQRQHFDKELEDMKRLLDVKSRECDELNDKISKMSEYCEQDKTRLSQEKERLKDEHAADLAREQAAFDRDRKELSDLLSEQRNQVRLLTKEAKSQQIIAAERANSLLQENKRLEALVCLARMGAQHNTHNTTHRPTNANPSPTVPSTRWN